MSLLVPDYASSSDDDEARHDSVVAPSPSFSSTSVADINPPASSSPNMLICQSNLNKSTTNVKKKKTKTTFYLPPEIQRLLERGTSGSAFSDDSDDEHELLAKFKRGKRGKRARPVADKGSVLGFLPPPKHEQWYEKATTLDDSTSLSKVEATKDQQKLKQSLETQEEVSSMDNAAAWQQYNQQQHLSTVNYFVGQGEDVSGGSSKRKRARERDIERALEHGHFETVEGQITDIQGPTPHTWEPPVDPTGAKEASEELSINLLSMKPTRLQRQKHQLNQLAFDAKVRNFELLEKRGAALKTKRETYAKYGW